MNISIFGLGYVGCVGAACLAKLGHRVVGVDVNENKVRLINEGKPTIIEEGIAELCAEAHEKGLMSATMDVREAVHGTDVSFIVVGTPSSKRGTLTWVISSLSPNKLAKRWLISPKVMVNG